MPLTRSRSTVLYAAFDAYPGLKGAQAHIRTNLRALANRNRQTTLLCLGSGEQFKDPESGAAVQTYRTDERNMLRRSEHFGRFLSDVADTMIASPPAVIHFRDIWSGAPLLSHPISHSCRFVFEVNGLPSIELPDHYPNLARNTSLLRRIRHREDDCLSLADRVITVCHRTAEYLIERGCNREKIAIIPNAADAPIAPPNLTAKAGGSQEDRTDREKRILYVGTLAPWQGLRTLLDAMDLLGHRDEVRLLLVASSEKGVKHLRRQVIRRGLGERVTILNGLHPREIRSLYTRSYLSVSPLSRGARNELQGCCPVKIVESMANATPVVASDLPVVRELVKSGETGLLFAPDSPRSLAAALESMLDDEALRHRLAQAAYAKARADFHTELFAARLDALYENLTGE